MVPTLTLFPWYVSGKKPAKGTRLAKKPIKDKEDETKESVATILARKVTSRTAGPVLIAIGLLYVVGTTLQNVTVNRLTDTLQSTILGIVLLILGVTVGFCLCLDAARNYFAGRRSPSAGAVMSQAKE